MSGEKKMSSDRWWSVRAPAQMFSASRALQLYQKMEDLTMSKNATRDCYRVANTVATFSAGFVFAAAIVAALHGEAVDAFTAIAILGIILVSKAVFLDSEEDDNA